MTQVEQRSRILMVGCGKMGGALLRQWVGADNIAFTVIDPHAEAVPQGAVLHNDRAAIRDEIYDGLVVAIKPQMVETVLPDYAPHLSKDGFIMSMAAGTSVERLQRVLENKSVIRIMPNLPSFIGKGVSGLYSSPKCTAAQTALAKDLMRLAGTVIAVDAEDGIDRITAAAGSGPGYIFEFARTFTQAAIGLGFPPDQARALVLETLSGTIEMALQSGDSLETLRDNVTSKNGTTEVGLNALNGDEALSSLMQNTLQAAYQRAVELR